MAKDQTRRLQPGILKADQESLSAINGLTCYSPANPKYTADKLAAARKSITDAQEIETQKHGDADAARDNTVAAEWTFHNVMLEAKNQVKAQYGADSNEVHAIGLTKTSEKAAPAAKAAPTPPAK